MESSFQPLLQWYILLPSFLESVFKFDYVEMFSFSSWFLSLLSLSWSFTAYSATLKKGALSVDVSPISRIILFTSKLCLIFARMNCIILFMYFWGPGEFYPGIALIVLHTLIMGALHYNFSNVAGVLNTRDTGLCNFKLLYACLINGLSNIFSHNFVRMYEQGDKAVKGKMFTFTRQFVFDMIFLIENIVLMSVGCSADIAPLNDINTIKWFVTAILLFHLLGLAQKITYYKKRY